MARPKAETEQDPGPVPEDDEKSFGDLWEGIDPDSRVSRGVYSIYKTATGGMHIAYRPDGADEDNHLPIPAPMVSMMIAASEGKGPLGRMKALAMNRLKG